MKHTMVAQDLRISWILQKKIPKGVSSIFCDIMRCSPSKLNQHLGAARRFHLQVEKHAEQETCMKQPTTHRYNLKDETLRHCPCDNFTSYIIFFCT